MQGRRRQFQLFMPREATAFVVHLFVYKSQIRLLTGLQFVDVSQKVSITFVRMHRENEKHASKYSRLD